MSTLSNSDGVTRRAVLAGGALALAPGLARAQDWPTRPVTLVVPFAAGTASDIIARGLADYLGSALGQPFVVDNRGGAGGNIGGGAVARATPDGYTILFATTGPAATNKLMYRSMAYDPQKDLTPIVLIGKSPIVIVARPNAPFSTLPELIAYAKATPGKVTVGYPGNGTLGHVTGQLLQKVAGVAFNGAQYRGSPPIITDLMGAQIDVGMDSIAPYIAPIQDHLLKGLAVASAKPLARLPDTPSAAQAGLPELDASVWYALLAPAGAPADVVANLNAATNDYIKLDKTKAFFNTIGVATEGGSPDELERFVDAEIAKWAPIIKEANISF